VGLLLVNSSPGKIQEDAGNFSGSLILIKAFKQHAVSKISS
jgi:hypothetical protein